MEAIILIIAVLVLWKIGVLATAKTAVSVMNDSVKRAAVMADNEMALKSDEHKVSVVKRYNKMEDLTEDQVKSAATKRAIINSFEL